MNARTLALAAALAAPAACATDHTTAPATHTAPPPSPAAAAPSLSRSAITLSAASLVADGVSAATITVTLKDSLGYAIGHSDGTIILQTSAGSLSSVTDHGNGTYTAILTAPVIVGLATIWTWLDGAQFPRTVSLPFVGGAADVVRSFVAADDSVVGANGTNYAVVSVYLRDTFGNPTDSLTGHVTMSTTAGTLGPVDRGIVGQYWSTLRSTTSGTAIVSAALDGRTISGTAHVRFAGGFWTNKSSMPFARQVLAAGVIGGTLYTVGGGAWTAGSYSSTVMAYEAAADRWTMRTPMPTARGELAAGVVNGVLYAVGGFFSTDLNTVEAFDPVTDMWSTKAPMPTAREGLAVGVVNGVLYAVGGNVRGIGSVTSYGHSANPAFTSPAMLAYNIQSSDHVLGTVEAYDPSTNTWTTKAPMPTPRSMLAVGVINGILYAMGGRTANADSRVVEAYDPATDTWTTKAPLLESYGRSAFGAEVLDGMLYAVGGFQVYGETSGVEAYNPASNSWTYVTPLLRARQSLGVGVINGVLYAVGGACYDDTLASVEALLPP